MQKEYLGDSVYAEIEGGMIKLTIENDSSGPSNTIYMEPAVYDALVQYVNRVKSEAQKPE